MRKTCALVTLAAALLAASAPAFAGPGCTTKTHTTTASTSLVPPSGQTASTLNQPTVPGN